MKREDGFKIAAGKMYMNSENKSIHPFMAPASNIRVDAAWIGMHRPFHLLKASPANPFHFTQLSDMAELMAASFYPDGRLEYLLSRKEVFHLEQWRHAGEYHTSFWTETYQDSGYFIDCSHFESEQLKIIPMDFSEWVLRSIECLWRSANDFKIFD